MLETAIFHVTVKNEYDHPRVSFGAFDLEKFLISARCSILSLQMMSDVRRLLESNDYDGAAALLKKVQDSKYNSQTLQMQSTQQQLSSQFSTLQQ